MIFETHEPAAPFNSLVESIFYFRDFQPDHSIERVVPTGHTFVIFELDGIERNTFDSKTLKPNASFRNAWVSGVHRNFLSISAHRHSEMFVIQFKPFGAYPFLHLPMQHLADKVVPCNDIPQAGLSEIREKLTNAESSIGKFAVADAWMASHYQEVLAAPKSIVDIVELLQAQPGSKLKEVVDHYEGTQKHLISQFKKFIGITPKQYQRILRFNDVFVQIQAAQLPNWSDIAHRCGYSDQSHFIREFRNFSGFNPESYRRQEFDEDASNFFPLDRHTEETE